MNVFRHARLTACAAVLAAGLTLAPAARAEDAKPPEGFVSLFNGKDLSGWKGDPELWKAENGEIIGTTEPKKITKNTFLATEKKYSDFVLKAKVKIRNGNSGIQFRSEAFDGYVVKGYQADVAMETYFGMLYEEGKRGIMPYWKALSEEERKAINAAAKLDDWNEYEIACKGDRAKIVLNGKTTLDMADPAGAKEGIIALQLHVGDPMRVEYKDLWIKETKGEPAKSSLDEAKEATQSAVKKGVSEAKGALNKLK